MVPDRHFVSYVESWRGRVYHWTRGMVDNLTSASVVSPRLSSNFSHCFQRNRPTTCFGVGRGQMPTAALSPYPPPILFDSSTICALPEEVEGRA